jgi:myo-inositol-1-phosphate synthase
MNRGVSGPLVGPSSWFMKSPPEQFTDDEARQRTLRFIRGDEVAPAPAVRAARLVS